MKVVSHSEEKENEKRSEKPPVRWYRVVLSGIYATTVYVEACDQEEAEMLARDIYEDATCDEFMEMSTFELEDVYTEEEDNL